MVSPPKQLMNSNSRNHRAILDRIAHQAMLERGLLPDFSPAVLAELERLPRPGAADGGPAEGSRGIRDMRSLVWASIDNDDSRDLDQLTVAEAMPGGNVRLLVAVADVVSRVRKGSARWDPCLGRLPFGHDPLPLLPRKETQPGPGEKGVDRHRNGNEAG